MSAASWIVRETKFGFVHLFDREIFGTERRGQVKWRFQLLLEGLTACRAIAGLENETLGDHPGNAVVKTLTVGLDP